MTDLDLQNAIVKELQKMKIKIPGEDGWKDISIYQQHKPFRQDGEPDEDYNEEPTDDYIMVVLGDEKTDGDGRWIVDVQLLFQIMSFDIKRDGEKILSNLMNQIDLHFTRKGIIAGKYEMEPEKVKTRNPLCDANYAQSAFVTKWKLPNMPVKMEVGNLT